MLGYADNIRFYLFSNEEGQEAIPPPKDYNAGNRDVFERQDEGKYFAVKKNGKMELFREAWTYLRKIEVLYGIGPDVRLIVQVKDDMRLSEDWKTVTNVGIDLKTMDFNDSEQTVKVDVKVGGLLDLIEKRFDDEYDIMPDESVDGTELSPLKTVQVQLTPRQIFKRSRWEVPEGTIVTATDDSGATATAIPFKKDYFSESHMTEVISLNMNSSGGDWADLQFSGSVLILNCPRRITYTLNGRVQTQITSPAVGSFKLDMVIFDGGQALNYVPSKKVSLDTCDPAGLGNECEYVFTNYDITLEEGESLAIGTLTDASGPFINTIEYEVVDTYLVAQTDDLYPQTTTKAIKPFDLFSRLISKIKGKENLFTSSVFGPGGAYENVLLIHGTWLRNMPLIINEGQDDERRVQASISLKQAYEAYSLTEPLAYDANPVGLDEIFEIETEKSTQGNFVGVKLGETRSAFVLKEISKVERKVIGDNYWGKITVGSRTSGSEYGEVNNLYSVCGNATWNTINKHSDSVYEVLSDVRTGAEDHELQRQKQYADNPDQDAEYDNYWFILDCKLQGGFYVPKTWEDYYETKPTNVYSADTNYNWFFTPARIFLRHGWKIKSGIDKPKYLNESVRFISSNCASSLITKKAGQQSIAEDGPLPHSIIDKPKINPMSVEFTLPINQEIIDALRVKGNLKGLVQFKTKNSIEYGRLIKVDTNGDGKWTLVEAKLN